MEDKQQAAYEAVMDMANSIAQNKYGEDANFDVEAWRDDLDELSYVVEPE